ncbi:MAG: hypothetical protein MJB14_13535 [Spirochaetes bacterium]|nr:hypothetical protein [Spirochaetota bacterium]
MIKRIFIFLFLLIIPVLVFAKSQPKWIKTEGVITEIRTVHSGRTRKEIATVEYPLQDNQMWSSVVEVYRLPVLGSGKKVGDKIKLNYKASDPSIVETTIGKYVTQYGMIVLIIIGIISSISVLRKSRMGQKNIS